MSPSQEQKLLMIEDDPSYAMRLRRNLESSGFTVTHCENSESGLAMLDRADFDGILTDIRLPGRSGLDFLGDLQERARQNPEETLPPVIVLTSVNTVDTAVEAMRKGAVDYITKEASRDEIVMRLQNVFGRNALVRENQQLKRTLNRLEEFDEIVGSSQSCQQLKQQIREIAPSDITVLITGPTGVGKELVARALHRASSRAEGPFIEVNCAALPDENLFLSELFGHEKGAFTGALARKRGQFELADGGTLFFDEIGELGPQAQARLLKAVEMLSFNRLGGEQPINVNCRLLFATNRDLKGEVKAGNFREDLYYRINVFPVDVPALRTRPDDIPPLARFFAQRFAEKHHLQPTTFDDGVLAALQSTPWPGNVRELRNVIERMAIRFAGRQVELQALEDLSLSGAINAGAIILPEGGVSLEEVEKNLVIQALQRTGWNQRQAASLLQISVDRMNARVKKFGLTHDSWRVHKQQ